MIGALKYFHTLRYLKPVQIYGRLWFRLQRPRPDLRPAPQVRTSAPASVEFLRKPVSLLGPGKFLFLGVEHEVRAASDWNHPSWGKLWLYNLHYFDDLNALAEEGRRASHVALLRRWMAENPPGVGNGWEPYPLSLRLVNWIKWLLRLQPASNRSLQFALGDEAFVQQLLHSLAVQARYLRRRLETHLLGNHLLANAKALVFAGALFAGDEASAWLQTGLALLREQVEEQVLADGGHFELSPMYHALVLEDLLDLLHLGQCFPDAGIAAADFGVWKGAASRMLAWLDAMSHPDGEIAFFNDAALGIAAAPAELRAYVARLGVERAAGGPARSVVRLADSGYIRIESGSAVGMLDVAAIGPDYLPGHAHADTLSFELSLFGQRMLVNSGTSRYGGGAERLRQRGTAAHNTLVVDGEDSSEVWGGFRVARRAYPVGLQVHEGPDVISVSCAHDGYLRLPGRVTHRREWWLRAGELAVGDLVSGRFGRAEARFHFHPAWEVAVGGDGRSGSARLPSGQTCRWEVSGGRVRIDDSSYHPHFGSSIANRCLAVELDGAELTTVFRWAQA